MMEWLVVDDCAASYYKAVTQHMVTVHGRGDVADQTSLTCMVDSFLTNTVHGHDGIEELTEYWRSQSIFTATSSIRILNGSQS